MTEKPTGGPPSVRSSIAWNLAAGPFVIVGNLVLIAFSIAIAGVANYGAWAIAFSAVSLLAQADLGVGAALVRQLANQRAALSLSIEDSTKAYGFLIFAVLSIVSPSLLALVSMVYFHEISGAPAFRLQVLIVICASGALAVTLIGRFYISVIQSYGLYYPERLATVGGIALRAGVMFILYLLGWGLAAVIAGDLVGVLVVTCGTWSYAHQHRMLAHRLVPVRGSRRAFTDLVAFSIPTFISSFATLGAIQVPLYFVGAMCGLTDAAVYSAITRVFQSGRTIFGWIVGPWLPDAASEVGRARPIASRHASCYLLMALVGGAGGSVGLLYGGEILTAWLGSGFAAYGAALSIVAAALYIHGLYAPGVIFATALGRPGIVAVNNIVILCLTVSLCGLLVGPFGTIGAAASVAVPIAIVFPVSQWMTTKCSGLSYSRSMAIGGAVICIDSASCWVLGGVFRSLGGIWPAAASLFAVSAASAWVLIVGRSRLERFLDGNYSVLNRGGSRL